MTHHLDFRFIGNEEMESSLRKAQREQNAIHRQFKIARVAYLEKGGFPAWKTADTWRRLYDKAMLLCLDRACCCPEIEPPDWILDTEVFVDW